MPEKLAQCIIVCGHYGAGKTNLTVNLALLAAGAGERVTVVDMDIVNPYFRTADHQELFLDAGIRLIAPVYANTNLDLPVLPPSVTTAIAMGIAESHGGVAGIAAAAVMVAGITGAVFAPLFARVFRITEPVAEGLAIGACNHALGTTRAMEIGSVQGAMSSIAICVCGIITSVLALFLR